MAIRDRSVRPYAITLWLSLQRAWVSTYPLASAFTGAEPLLEVAVVVEVAIVEVVAVVLGAACATGRVSAEPEFIVTPTASPTVTSAAPAPSGASILERRDVLGSGRSG